MDVMVSLPMQAFIRDLRQGSRQSIRDCVQGLEDLGYWGVIVVDHILRSDTDVAEHHDEEHFNWRFPDPLSTLGYLAAITTTVRVGTRILVVPYRSPIATAHAVATVDSLSGGRVVLGVAPGYDASEFVKLGVPRTKRGRLTDEYLDVMRTLWAADGPVDFDGPTVSFQSAELQLGPVQRPGPPLWVGGNTQVALERAVRRRLDAQYLCLSLAVGHRRRAPHQGPAAGHARVGRAAPGRGRARPADVRAVLRRAAEVHRLAAAPGPGRQRHPAVLRDRHGRGAAA